MVNVRLIPSSFDPKADAKALRDAMEGLGKLDSYRVTALFNPRLNIIRMFTLPHGPCSYGGYYVICLTISGY